MQSLAQFASAAYNTASLIEDLKRNSEELENSQAELRKRVADLQTTTEALKSANVDLKHFAYAVSHDLRQPLRAITSYCELLLRRSRLVLGEEAAAWGDFITSGCRRMEALLRDLLAFAEAASIDRDTTELVDSDAAFEIAVQNLRVAIQETQATITRDRLPVIRRHKAHIIQLMQNLIGNSIKYRSDKPSRIHATAEPLRTDGTSSSLTMGWASSPNITSGFSSHSSGYMALRFRARDLASRYAAGLSNVAAGRFGSSRNRVRALLPFHAAR